jgi:hypothetical protein
MNQIATRIAGKREGLAKKLGIPKPLKAIRLKCLNCSNGQPSEVLHCPVKNCALYPYRMGRYPKVTAKE